MGIFDWPLWRSIQIGVDVATSITIVGAVISWFLTSRHNQKKERQRGINDAARAIAVEGIQGILVKLSQDFNRIALSASQVERRIDMRAQRGFEVLQRSIESGELRRDSLLRDLNQTRELVSDFFEASTSTRYLLIPALHSLPEGPEAIRVLKTDFEHIQEAYNQISGGWIGLLSEFDSLLDNIDDARSAGVDDEALLERCLPAIHSILFDARYADWVESFAPEGREAEFRAGLADPSEMDKKLLTHLVLAFWQHVLDNPARLTAQIMVHVSRSLMKTRIECKEFMVNLAAIAARLIAKDNSQPIPELARTFNGEDYFDTRNEIR